MIEVALIGGGNMAVHLAAALASSKFCHLRQMLVRNTSADVVVPSGTQRISDYRELLPSDLYIVAVSDKAIAEVIAAIPYQDAVVAHTSGMTEMMPSSRHRHAVFYPLMSFSAKRAVDFRHIPICIEAGSEKDEQMLSQLASSLSDSVFRVSTQQRKSLHLAAVFANNFVNQMYLQAKIVCDDHQLSFDMLKPLIAETANKMMDLDPEEAQTGPARRRDERTIDGHLQLLEREEQADIYKRMTKLIQQNG